MDDQITNDLERIWKDVFVAMQMYCPNICLQGPRKYGIGDVPAEIRAQYLKNASQDRHR
jgi:hypothetical protein